MELTNIKYISDKRASQFNKIGVNSVEDLASYFPRYYLDLTKITKVSEAYNNDCILTVARVELEPRVSNNGRIKYAKTYCSQGADTFEIVWFNQPYVAEKLECGKEYFFYGRVRNKFGVVSMTNPIFESVEDNKKLKGFVPVYSIKGNLTQSMVRYSCQSATKLLYLESQIPSDLIYKYSLMPLKKAYMEIHNPTTQINLNNAQERIALEEYFSLISAFRVLKGDKKRVRRHKYTCSAPKLNEFTKTFGFEFTDGQKKAVNEVYSDLTGATVMNRLIQGDVGCGKTAVSLCALYMAFTSGFQTAFLAPTEVLARQNYNIAVKHFGAENVCFLSGSLTVKQKRELKHKIKDGEYKIVVGTHAIIEPDVEFKNLALCVCDEQQRFGVAQRSALEEKGEVVDVLVMSATPIPRTLSLIFYGDLDISTIYDKPKMRTTLNTHVVPENKYDDLLSFVNKEIGKGNRAYFVCPKIEGDDEGTLMSVKELYEDLSSALKNVKFALMHGKLKDSQKIEIMNDFKSGKVQALVSTTVIEVGVDVKDATVMVIYNAERFGLSQLHQLRGRIGRGDKESFCFLLDTAKNQTAKDRLKIIKTCADGFKISEADYDLRGGGDLLGMRQSGNFLTTLGVLKYSSKTIFFAKQLSDEAFNDEKNIPTLKKLAITKQAKLKDITLN
ncbi:MAG: ATP-dependent DNA helicase RecG [Clostridia bacterium]|nr:ATP-dependent DNA helicase RecG [Clostridia bacterium]